MYLFLWISIITFLWTFCEHILKFLSLGSLFAKHTNDPHILEEIQKAKEELNKIEQSTLGDYAKMVRRLRAENKISGLVQKLNGELRENLLKDTSADLICRCTVKGVLLLLMVITSIKYRYTPVVVFDDRFNFTPFSGIVTFPTGVSNAVSVPSWVLACNLTFRWLGGFIKVK